MLEKISQKFWKGKEKQQKGDKVFEMFEIAGAKIVAVGVNLYPEDNNISEKGINQIFLIICVGAMPMETEKRMARKCIRKI